MSFTSLSVVSAVVITNINERAKNTQSKEHRLSKKMRNLFINHILKILRMHNNAKQLLKLMAKSEIKRLNIKSKLKDKNEKYKYSESNDNLSSSLHENYLLKIKRTKSSEHKPTKLGNKNQTGDYHYIKVSRDLNKRNKSLELVSSKSTTNVCSSPIWVNRKNLNKNYFDYYSHYTDDNLSDDSREDIMRNLEEVKILQVGKRLSLRENSKSSKTKSSKSVKKYKKYYILKRDNVLLYFSYEWVLFALGKFYSI